MNNNPYWYWWAFLQKSNEANWSDDVKRNFVKTDCFDEWWNIHKHLFEQAPSWYVFEAGINDVKDYEGANDTITVIVNLLEPKIKVMKALSNLINQRMEKHVGRPKTDDMADVYPFATRPEIVSLDTTLRVWKMRNLANPPSLYEIGAAIPLSLHLVKPEDSKASASDKKRRMQSHVSRYVKWGREIIANVEKGVFPKHR